MHIVLISDLNMMRFIPANLVQISMYAKTNKKVSLITDCAHNEELLVRAKATAKKLQIKLEIIYVDESDLALPTNNPLNKIPKIAITKLFLHKLLPKESAILYIDVDCMIRQPIDDLLAFEFSTPIAAVEEVSRNSTTFPAKNTISSYFNTGVMLMSLDAFRKPTVSRKVNKLLADGVTTQLLTSRVMDQDIFNYLFSDSVTLLPRRFNQFAKNTNSPWLSSFVQNVTILHFSGLEKPWKYPHRSQFTKEWLKTFKIGVAPTPQSKDIAILKSWNGIFNISKALIPIYYTCTSIYEKVKIKTPRSIKNFIRSI